MGASLVNAENSPEKPRDNFRKALGEFATGVTVITALDPETGSIHGMTANSFTSVSLHPPLILVCIDEVAHMLKCLGPEAPFAVNILTSDQKASAQYFAVPSKNQVIEDCPAKFGPGKTPSGAPYLLDCLATVDCKVTAAHPTGDHTIIVGSVQFLKVNKGEPLLYLRGEFEEFSGSGNRE